MRSPSWKYGSSIYLPKKHCTLYRDDDLGAQLQVMLKREWIFIPPREKAYYFIDGVERAFKSERGLMHALERRNRKQQRSMHLHQSKESLFRRPAVTDRDAEREKSEKPGGSRTMPSTRTNAILIAFLVVVFALTVAFELRRANTQSSSTAAGLEHSSPAR